MTNYLEYNEEPFAVRQAELSLAERARPQKQRFVRITGSDTRDEFEASRKRSNIDTNLTADDRILYEKKSNETTTGVTTSTLANETFHAAFPFTRFHQAMAYQ